MMKAAYATSFSQDDPVSGLTIGERPEPHLSNDWVVVNVLAATLNHHDLWSLRGVGILDHQLPMILGCDAAGVDTEGNEVVVHAVISDPHWRDDETLDPRRSLLSERFPGTLAQRVAVPRRNLVPKPPELSFEQAACLPTTWLTAYRMMFTKAGIEPGETVLVQGAGGGVATALTQMGAATGVRVWVASRDPEKAERSLELGAERIFKIGERLPEHVDAVIDTVGEATLDHSLRSLRPGGVLVTAGATSGHLATINLRRVFFLQLQVLGSTMGTREELLHVLSLAERTGVRPVIDRVIDLDSTSDGLRAMERGEVFGKVVVTI